MRLGYVIAGFVLAAVGAYITFVGVSYTKEASLLKFGTLEAKYEQKHRVPEWIGGMGLGAGLVFVVIGFRRR